MRTTKSEAFPGGGALGHGAGGARAPRPAGASPADTTGRGAPAATAAQAPPAPPAPAADAGPVRLSEEVVVQAVRAEERTPVTKTDIGRDAIELVNRGQEMPFLLGATPAVNFQSDTGLAAGYAYFNIRGIGPTRLNVTLDGVPLQDPEDQALYFSNFGDFASVVDSIQVQRGVGTSSVGAASYGGSVNFASVSPADRRGLEAQVGGGSWGTGRGTLAGNSGLLGGAWGLYARALGPDDERLPRALGRRPGHALLRRDALGRPLALQALRLLRPRADPARLPRHRRGDARDGPARERALARTRRTASARTSSRRSTRTSWATSTTLMAQAYYNGAQGWFRIWDGGRENLQQYGIDGHFVGLVLGRHAPPGPPGPQLGRPRQRLHARPLHGRGRRLARVPEHRAEERVQHVPEDHLGRGPRAALGRRAGPRRALRVPRATSRSAP